MAQIAYKVDLGQSQAKPLPEMNYKMLLAGTFILAAGTKMPDNVGQVVGCIGGIIMLAAPAIALTRNLFSRQP